MTGQAEWRRREGISQQKLAAMLSAELGRVIHQSSVSQWELRRPGGRLDLRPAAMPVSVKRSRATGATVVLHTCEVCGADASFGRQVHFRAALKALDSGDARKAKRLLGFWYCSQHRPGAS